MPKIKKEFVRKVGKGISTPRTKTVYEFSDYQGRPTKFTLLELIKEHAIFPESVSGGVFEDMQDQISSLQVLVAALVDILRQEEHDKFIRLHLTPLDYGPKISSREFCGFPADCSYPKCGCKHVNDMGKPKKKTKKK